MSYKFLYINSKPGADSIHQFGLLAYNAICNDEGYTVDYANVNELDNHALHEGKIIHNGVELAAYDAYIFNYHWYTVRQHGNVRSEEFHKLPGLKFALIMEVFPNNPVVGPLDISVAHNDFHGYMIMDPTLVYPNPIFHAFPRPLGKANIQSYEEKEIPVIGTFGLAGTGRNLTNLVRAVNAEFDRAVIRFNFAPGSYFGDVNGVAKREVLGECAAVAKQGIEIQLTEHFFTDHELLEWLGQNTLNVFLYARGTSGISSAADQALMSGRPILTSDDIAFRHIHQYIPPYPQTSLQDAIKIGTEKVAEMQNSWNYDSFKQKFKEMILPLLSA